MSNYTGQIISASRRTDIPAFYGQWFLDRVKQEFVDVPHPFSGKSYRVSLKPEDVSATVFWSKDYQSFLAVLKEINARYQRRFIFHFTINGYRGRARSLLEPLIPDEKTTIETAARLTEIYGKDRLMWRFDPIVFSSVSPPEERIRSFRRLCKSLEGITERCYISFIDIYGKVQRRFERAAKEQGIQFNKPSPEVRIDTARRIREIAAHHGITVHTCCENEIAEAAGIDRGHCVDNKLLSQLYPNVEFTGRIKPTRKGCGCYESRDIGTYNRCRHHCLYCYANK